MEDDDRTENANDSIDTDKKTMSRRSSKKKMQIWPAALALFLLVVVVGVVFGRIAIAILPGTKAVVVSGVCTAGDIATFNKDLAEGSYKDVIKGIANRAGSTGDVNCVFMEYSYFFDRLQYSQAREKAASIEKLVNAGNSIDNRIDNVQSIQTIRQNVEATNGLEDGKLLDDGSNAQ